MRKKEDITLKINDLNFPNKGTGFHLGRCIEVKDTLPGQIVSARINRKRKTSCDAKLLQVIQHSFLESPSRCPHFPSCGGCAYQNLDYSIELEIKETQVLRLLHQHDISGFSYLGIESAPCEKHYRNKCEFSFGDTGLSSGLALGMRKVHSRYEVIDLTHCQIVDDDFIAIIQHTKQYFQHVGLPFYHTGTHTGVLRHLVVRKGWSTGELLINIVTTSQQHLNLQEYARLLCQIPLMGKISGVLHTENDSLADVVTNQNTQLLYGRNYFVEKILGLEFTISPFSFFQTNSAGAEKLYSIVKDFVGADQQQVIFDLYCGTGTISQILSQNAKQVIGIEIVEEAVAAAKENAKRNHIENCTFIAGDVLAEIDHLPQNPDIIVLDPPREGIHPKALQKIANLGASKLIYVSCKPTSLAINLSDLLQCGYQLDKIKLMDMFPRTRHVECCCLLTKK